MTARLAAIAVRASGPRVTGRPSRATATTSAWVSGWVPICNGLVTTPLDDAPQARGNRGTGETVRYTGHHVERGGAGPAPGTGGAATAGVPGHPGVRGRRGPG